MPLFVDLQAFADRPMKPAVFDSDFLGPAVVGIPAAPSFLVHAAATIAEVKKTIQILESQPRVKIIHTKQDLMQVVSSQYLARDTEKLIGVVLGLQQLPYDANLEVVEELYDLGIRLATLAYKDNESPYAGGFLSDKPLTETGVSLMEMMAQVGMWLDLSHSGHRTARMALDTIKFGLTDKLRVLATHTGAYSVYNFTRNLPDDVLLGIAENRGLVGLYCLTFGLDPEDDSFTPFCRHLNHVRRICGNEVVAIGTDGTYRHVPEHDQREQFELMSRKVDPDGRMRSRFPVEPKELNTPDRELVLKSVLSNLAHLNSDAVSSVMHGNALRFLEENLPNKVVLPAA